MTYQLGSIIGWPGLRKAIAEENYAKAADEILLNKDKTGPSLLAKQTPNRAKKYADTLREIDSWKETIPVSSIINKPASKPAPKKEEPVIQKSKLSDEEKSDMDLFLEASVEDKIQIATNGITKKGLETKAKVETAVDDFIDNLKYDVGMNELHKAKMPSPQDLEKIRKEVTTRVLEEKRKKRVEEQIKNEKEATKYIDLKPAEIKQQAYNIKKLKFDARNRGDYKDTNTSGMVIQTLNKITNKPSFQKGRQVIALNKNTGELEFPESEKDIKKDGNYVFTTQNKWENIKDFDINDKKYDNANGTGTFFPHLIDSKNKKYTYQVGAKKDDNSQYGGLYGGKMLIISENKKHQMLFVGSVAKLKNDFDEFKKNTHSSTVTIVMLDQGAFNKPHTPPNNYMSKKDWKTYDNQNVLGGHGFYITGSR
jgi:hypothetical protein